MSELKSLEPKLIWNHFDQITKVPRPSKHEEAIAAHVEAWAADKNFEIVKDAIGNIVVKIPGRGSTAGAPTLVLQAHLDMVCEKNSDVELDFFTDPIPAYIDGDWVRARGTTLGADNGIGVAAMMAVGEDDSLIHPPLELLFTLDEETGLTGAMHLDASILDGTILINLDTEEDGFMYIGCAGGGDSFAKLPLQREALNDDSKVFELAVKGLKGGHSGCDIHLNRGNALKLVGRALASLIKVIPELQLISFNGGSKHNAIPREAFVKLAVPAGNDEAIATVIAASEQDFVIEFGTVEPGLAIGISPSSSEQAPLTRESRDRLLGATLASPHGVLAMSREVAGLVETSSNLATVHTEDKRATSVLSHRSSVMPALLATQQQAQAAWVLAGAEVEVHDAYPGWKPDPDTDVIARSIKAFETAHGETLKVMAVHAGLECGLLLEKKPEMEAISIGPEIRNPHSPDECVQISSVARFYKHLEALLADYAGA